MSIATRVNPGRDQASELEQKQIALSYLHEAWGEARLEGVDGDCLAQAALFTALTELVTTSFTIRASRMQSSGGRLSASASTVQSMRPSAR